LCLCINFANAEIYLWLAGVFRRYGSQGVIFKTNKGGLELVDTYKSDMEMCADGLIPIVKPGSKIV
jgi:hypothetical protein